MGKHNKMVPMIYACDANENLAYIDDVANGNACNCTCPICKERVSAHQGKQRQHSFCHLPGSKCPGPSEELIKKWTTISESELHKTAKRIISRNKLITIPPTYLNLWTPMIYPILLIDSEKHSYENPKEEYNAGNYRSDVRISTKHGKTDVEICVEHPIDEAKLEKVRKANARMFEITLTDLVKNTKGPDSGILYKDLREEVLHNPSRRKWINQPYSNRIRNDILKETRIEKGRLYIDKNYYCRCNYLSNGYRLKKHTRCRDCRFYRVDPITHEEYCASFSQWFHLLPVPSQSSVLSKGLCPYCGAPLLRVYDIKEGRYYIQCTDKQCRFRLDYDKTKAKLADAHLSMPDYLTKA